ncbi:helix-turn-helix domain-containing protein [Streptomyces virginiae]|uniref:helix-turn-helix domain-containing protein n=1 Tax=Streptomyces virginiae TaxID=1961 RepID=UPI003680DD87
MTTAQQQQMIPSQTAIPLARASRRLRCDLPEPGERRRLREQWGLSTGQVAVAFGVTPATVRSWECGRSTPRGGRKEAYQRFLAGLAQHGDLAPHGDTRPGDAAGGTDRRRRRRTAGVLRPAPRSADTLAPALRQAVAPLPAPPPAPAAGGVVGVVVGGPDPVAPESIRRLRLLGAAACLWSLALWVIITCPPPF